MAKGKKGSIQPLAKGKKGFIQKPASGTQGRQLPKRPAIQVILPKEADLPQPTETPQE